MGNGVLGGEYHFAALETAGESGNAHETVSKDENERRIREGT